MSETIKKGWIEDEEGNKFAPKTTTDQVQTGDGVTILDYITTLLDELVRGLSKSDVGLNNVDNTSDLDKPISTSTRAELDNKAPSDHNHDERYYTETEVNQLITNTRLPVGSYYLGTSDNNPQHICPLSYGTWEYQGYSTVKCTSGVSTTKDITVSYWKRTA